MKYLGWIIRLIVAGAGLTLSGYAAYLGWRTMDILNIEFIPKSERLFQQTRLGAHVIGFVLGLALVILAIPRRRKEPLPTPPPKAVKYRIFAGIVLFFIFVSSCLSYIRELGKQPFKPEDDVSVKVAATLFWLFAAVICFKWKSTVAKKSEPETPS